MNPKEETIRCDICGKEIPKNRPEARTTIGIRKYYKNPLMNSKVYDLCRDCYRELIEHMTTITRRNTKSPEERAWETLNDIPLNMFNEEIEDALDIAQKVIEEKMEKMKNGNR